MATTPALNVELLDATLAEVRRAARRKTGDTWDQENWRIAREGCGSAMCFAGWAVQLSGAHWTNDMDLCTAARGQREEEVWMKGGVRVTCAWARARYVLGLTNDEAGRLFDGDNSLGDLSRIVRQIKAGELR